MNYLLARELFTKMNHKPIAVADPGFPIGGGGVHPLGEGVDLRHGHFSVKMYVKMKELGPIGGGACTGHAPLDPPMH